MDCKHSFVDEKTTKYYVCKIYRRAVDQNKCGNCPLRLRTDFIEYFNETIEGSNEANR